MATTNDNTKNIVDFTEKRGFRMILAHVVGNVVATQKNQNLIGAKLMILQPMDTKGAPAGDEFIAVDGIGAGVGDLVLCIAEGGSARAVYKNSKAPIDTVIAGIVDVVESEDGALRL
jgi:microcompartment protein CcmK/EutM